MLKKIIFLITLTIAFVIDAQVSPGANCSQAGCSTTGSYSNLSGVPSMGSYSCLGSTPNANWLAIGIANNGSVHLQLDRKSVV